ncbi:MAG: aromatic-ring-hydroxylating dioxygenase subunit beta [Alphaproteobacteria bacterium]|nr:aromatic-ring-hydroxylating dioxygenase subunit beta [Alphaproteobacteria bacterium]
MTSPDLQHKVEQFLFREVRMLAEGRFEEWLDLFTEDTRYLMPIRETTATREDSERGEEFLPHVDDDKDFMRARVQRLRHHLAHAEQPPSRLRYFVSNIEVEDAEGGEKGDLDVRCNLLVYQSRLERTEKIFVGRREDRLRPEKDSFLIASRTVVLDQSLLPRSITIFF